MSHIYAKLAIFYFLIGCVFVLYDYYEHRTFRKIDEFYAIPITEEFSDE